MSTLLSKSRPFVSGRVKLVNAAAKLIHANEIAILHNPLFAPTKNGAQNPPNKQNKNMSENKIMLIYIYNKISLSI